MSMFKSSYGGADGSRDRQPTTAFPKTTSGSNGADGERYSLGKAGGHDDGDGDDGGGGGADCSRPGAEET